MRGRAAHVQFGADRPVAERLEQAQRPEMVDVAAGPQVEGCRGTDAYLGRAALERPTLGRLDERATMTTALCRGFDGDELDVADAAGTFVGDADRNRALTGRQSEHGAVPSPATERKLRLGEPFVGERAIDERGELGGALARPHVHYRRLVMGRVRRLAMTGLVAAAIALGAGCQHEGNQVPGRSDGASLDFTSRATVTVDDDAITPNSVQVQVGDAITVVNKGTRDHGLTSASIDTGTLRPGESTVVFLTESGRIDAYDRDNTDRRLDIEVAADGS